MKRSCFTTPCTIIVLLILFIHKKVSAQVTPPAYPSTILVNYIRTWDAMAPFADPNELTGRPLRDVKQATQYFDGLGRSLQTVVKQGSLETGGTATDLVSPVVYDEFGREQYNYLPFAANSSGGNNSLADGAFKLNPFQQQAAFMSAQYGSQGETFFYSKTNFEASPLSRIQKMMAPGNSWAGSDRGIETKYWFNTSSDDVKIWNVTDVANGFGTYTVNGSYAGGVLYKNVSVDEHGKQVIEFKDKEGQVILKKVQLTAIADDGTGRNYTGWLCTYYIYDDLNRLRSVVQPRGVESLTANSWQLTASLYDEQCFRYEYDERGRMVMKKVPGAGEMWMVYDARDRLVLTQDANLRAQGKWMYTMYENGLNRPVSTGLWTNSNDRQYHKSYASASVNYPNLSGQTYEELTNTFYDSYSWLSTYGNPLPSGYNNSYDTYFQPASNIQWPYPQAGNPSGQLKGMITGSRVKVMGTSTCLYTVNYYDDKGKLIQVQSTNITGGTDITTTQYTWAGQPLITVQKSTALPLGGGGGGQTTVIVTQYTYDEMGRVSEIEKKQSNTLVNSNAMSSYKTIAQNEYDKLGQLKKKTLSPSFGGGGLETENFEYNIRGWLLGMNRAYARDAAPPSGGGVNYFGFDLGYDKTNNNLVGGQSYAAAQYNGNITGMVWKSRGDEEKRKYDFSYDAANRLMKAGFTQYNGTVFNTSAGVDFSVKMGDGTNVNTAYDANGNIRQMQQWGWKSGGSVQIDNLAYQYLANSNKLMRVTDAATGGNGGGGDFHDGTNTGTDDYGYDANGNLNLDNNKSISSITYSHLNMPQMITVAGKGTISYTYDAAGNKLMKTVNETGHPAKTTLYIAGAVYQNDTLQFIGMEEGRIRPLPATNTGWAYDYMLKDHLGNVRMVLTDEQQQDKYPVASLEDAKINLEEKYYNIQTANIVYASKVTGLPAYTNDNGIGNTPSDPAFEQSNSQKLYRLNSNTNKTGLGMTLKVMAGDRINIFGKSYYFQNNTGGTAANSSVPVLEILNGLAGSANGTLAAAGHGDVTGTQLNNLPGTTGGINTLLSQQTTESGSNPNRPKAYINYIFLDEQFNYVAGGFSPAGSNSQLKDHYSELQNITAQKSGYLYIYVSNESPVNVYFDNLQVVHTRSPILEETHYYPFGLVMEGISSKALAYGKENNKYKFQGQEFAHKEFSDGTGLNIYEFRYRMNDPQTGRFWQIDPMASQYAGNSTYAFAENRVMNGVDLEGLEWAKVTDGSKTVGYMWDPANAYDEGGNLKDGYFKTALYFTDNGTFDENSHFNIGSSTATVFKADGNTEEYEACVYPAKIADFATVPEGDYLASTGSHKQQYTALHMTNTGEFDNAVVNLGYPNPNPNSGHYGQNIADGIHIHHAGGENTTGKTSSGKNVSEGCLLINVNQWKSFINNFLKGKSTKNTPTSVTISRSSSKPKILQRFYTPMSNCSVKSIVRWNSQTHTYTLISAEELQSLLQPPSMTDLSLGIERYNPNNIPTVNKPNN